MFGSVIAACKTSACRIERPIPLPPRRMTHRYQWTNGTCQEAQTTPNGWLRRAIISTRAPLRARYEATIRHMRDSQGAVYDFFTKKQIMNKTLPWRFETGFVPADSQH